MILLEWARIIRLVRETILEPRFDLLPIADEILLDGDLSDGAGEPGLAQEPSDFVNSSFQC